MLTMVSLNTWGNKAARIWENAVQHPEWCNVTPYQRALQVGVTDPRFQLPTPLDAMEAQMRADLLSEKVLPDPILTLAYQKKATTVSQILVLIFQQYMPAESAVRLDGMSAMEQPLRPSKTFDLAMSSPHLLLFRAQTC